MRVWTLQDAGPHKTLIKCDDYEIVTMYTRRDLLEFIVAACNAAEGETRRFEGDVARLLHLPDDVDKNGDLL